MRRHEHRGAARSDGGVDLGARPLGFGERDEPDARGAACRPQQKSAIARLCAVSRHRPASRSSSATNWVDGKGGEHQLGVESQQVEGLAALGRIECARAPTTLGRHQVAGGASRRVGVAERRLVCDTLCAIGADADAVREELGSPGGRGPGRRGARRGARPADGCGRRTSSSTTPARSRCSGRARRGCGASSTASTSTASRSATRRLYTVDDPQRRRTRAPRHGPRAPRARARSHRRRRARGHDRAARAARSGRQRRSRPRRARTSPRSSSPTPGAPGCSRPAGGRGRRGRSRTAPRSPTGSRSAPTGRARRLTSAPAPTSTAGAIPPRPTGIADHRLAATRACVATGAAALHAGRVVATLRHHGDRAWGAPGSDPSDVSPPPADVDDDWDGVTVCMHVRGYQVDDRVDGRRAAGRLRGTAARVGRARAARAPACTCPCSRRATCRSSWPSRRLGPLRRAARPGRGRRRGDELAEIRAVLGPLEGELWEEADAAGTVGDAWRRLDDASTKLSV